MSTDLVFEPLTQRVAKEIRAEMARQGLTQSALGASIGQSQNYIWYRLSGRKALTLTEVEQIAQALGIDVARLITG